MKSVLSPAPLFSYFFVPFFFVSRGLLSEPPDVTITAMLYPP